jgi:hypothetical protein
MATDGNDRTLINYQLRNKGGYHCPIIPGVPDSGQSWHCLRRPVISGGQIASLNVDLPQAEQPRVSCHVRFQLERDQRSPGNSSFWIVRVPSELMDGHNDVFNGRARLLMMALIQISGATMSVHRSFDAMFEPEQGSCPL